MPLNATDRVFVVTGANSGIGKATALGLARPGGTVVMACRNADRSEAARQDIVRQSGNAHVAVMIIDLASEASTRAFAKEFQRRVPGLPALFNKSGVYISPPKGTPESPGSSLRPQDLHSFPMIHVRLQLLSQEPP